MLRCAPGSAVLPDFVQQHSREDNDAGEPPLARRRTVDPSQIDRRPGPTVIPASVLGDREFVAGTSDGNQTSPWSLAQPFACPLCSNKAWSSKASLKSHLEQFHTICDDEVPQSFWNSLGWWVCSECAIISLVNKSCRRCRKFQQGSRKRVAPADVAPADSAAQSHVDHETFRRLLSHKAGCIRHIPQGARFGWGYLLSDTLEVFNDNPTPDNLYYLLSLPRAILHASKARGGHKADGGKLLGTTICRRMEKWRAGLRDVLIAEAWNMAECRLGPGNPVNHQRFTPQTIPCQKTPVVLFSVPQQTAPCLRQPAFSWMLSIPWAQKRNSSSRGCTPVGSRSQASHLSRKITYMSNGAPTTS